MAIQAVYLLPCAPITSYSPGTPASLHAMLAVGTPFLIHLYYQFTHWRAALAAFRASKMAASLATGSNTGAATGAALVERRLITEEVSR